MKVCVAFAMLGSLMVLGCGDGDDGDDSRRRLVAGRGLQDSDRVHLQEGLQRLLHGGPAGRRGRGHRQQHSHLGVGARVSNCSSPVFCGEPPFNVTAAGGRDGAFSETAA